MNKDALKKRTKFCQVRANIITQSAPIVVSRREPNWVDNSELNTENVVADFFEYEKELSEMTASNKTRESDKQ